ncbi:glycosyltransferase family 4 protein [Sphingobium sp. D43FB]|uniref:glycosyltransferase family 4 protein n=1 Tax=Sphingobium sp. D43FB TaxID=2017595 RepID=UPI000BB53642|nr:glycosyltransferase family 4 protein [Sphingobium sp. D43FB]PBN43568.1 glycosyl transferase family 1 [Sphingobium sp. D43FB]
MKHSPLDSLAAVPAPQHIALIGNSMPRRCGIATFTTHCHDALRAAFPAMRIDSYAMDDGADGIVYPDGIHPIDRDDRAAYADAACRIEDSGAQAIWLQHEFGIFGGAAGDMILHLLERTRLPLVLTLHTISQKATPDEHRVMAALLRRASKIMVMAGQGRTILIETYGVDDAMIAVIPHGVPDRPYVDPAEMKRRFGWEGHRIILTFGLLAPDKGIDHMIRAMPAIVEAHPDALYVVLGATHPNLVRERGESMREGLVALAQELGVGNQVRFIDRYVEQEELLDTLQAADIYVTPYVNPAQIVSGTLSYAIGMGKPVLSTPYVQAQEILSEDRGVVVPFQDAGALSEQIMALLSDEALLRGYAARAYAYGRKMIWSELARHVGDLMIAAIFAHPDRQSLRRSYAVLPPDPSAVLRMSDATGIFQHGILTIPDRRHGYCIDDNARALILMAQMEAMDEGLRDKWMTTYASFVQHAWNPDRGRFRNFMGFDRRWCEEEGSEDSCGRALWALGVTVRDALSPAHREWAAQLFEAALGPMASVTSPRAQAFVILGAGAILDADPAHRSVSIVMAKFADHISALLDAASRPGWTWFEGVLAYDNARLPEALLVAGRHLGRVDLIERGLISLEWIGNQQKTPEGYFRPVGSESFGRTHKPPLPYDQQPLEAQATIDAAVAAWDVDPDKRWVLLAETAYRWFLGHNDLDSPLATPVSGGCFDGLTPLGPNRNQGAESLIALQLASCAMMRLSQRVADVAQRPATVVPIAFA